MNETPYFDEEYHPRHIGPGCLIPVVFIIVFWSVFFWLLWNYALS